MGRSAFDFRLGFLSHAGGTGEADICDTFTLLQVRDDSARMVSFHVSTAQVKKSGAWRGLENSDQLPPDTLAMYPLSCKLLGQFWEDMQMFLCCWQPVLQVYSGLWMLLACSLPLAIEAIKCPWAACGSPGHLMLASCAQD